MPQNFGHKSHFWPPPVSCHPASIGSSQFCPISQLVILQVLWSCFQGSLHAWLGLNSVPGQYTFNILFSPLWLTTVVTATIVVTVGDLNVCYVLPMLGGMSSAYFTPFGGNEIDEIFNCYTWIWTHVDYSKLLVLLICFIKNWLRWQVLII